MNKCYLDANVLIYFKNEDSQFFQSAKQTIKLLIEKNFQPVISSLVLDEFLHGFLRLLIVAGIDDSERYQRLNKALKDVLKIPKLQLINPPTDHQSQMKIITLMRQYGLKPRDAYHLLTLQSYQVKHLATFDDDFEHVFTSGSITQFKNQT